MYAHTLLENLQDTAVSIWDRNISEWKKRITGSYEYYHAWLQLRSKSQLVKSKW